VREQGNKIIGGASIHPTAPFFSATLLKVTLHTVRLLLTQKFSKTTQLLGALPIAPDPIVHCAYLFIRKIHTAYFEFQFHCLDCLSPIFAPTTEKSFPHL